MLSLTSNSMLRHNVKSTLFAANVRQGRSLPAKFTGRIESLEARLKHLKAKQAREGRSLMPGRTIVLAKAEIVCRRNFSGGQRF